MSSRVAILLGLLLLAPAALHAGEEAKESQASPVGLWRLDRATLDRELGDDPHGMLTSLFVPDIELRVYEGGRYETWTKFSGVTVDGQVSGGTWVQSGQVVSFAGIRDDGQPGSVIARLKSGLLVLEAGPLGVPLTRVSDDPEAEGGTARRRALPHRHAAPPGGQDASDVEDAPPEEGRGKIGLGPGPSIEMPRPARENEPWPPAVITSGNRRQVARRIGAEVAAAVAADRDTSVDALWKGFPPALVVHVRGGFDNAQSILEAWGLPHLAMSPRELLERADELLLEARVVLIPCMEKLPPSLETGLKLALRQFVGRGGYLATTDGSVLSVLVAAFPDLVSIKGPERPTPEIICQTWIPPAAKREAALIRGLPMGSTVELWCEQASFHFELPDPKAYVTLMASNTLHLQLERGRVMAFSARQGKGKLLHALPHLFQERGKPGGARALQRLFLNFVLEGLDARPSDSR